jgi:hypothetical protein
VLGPKRVYLLASLPRSHLNRRVYVGGYNDDAPCDLGYLDNGRRRRLGGTSRQLAQCKTCIWKFKDSCGKDKSWFRRRLLATGTIGPIGPIRTCDLADACCCKKVVSVTGISEYCNGKTFANSAALRSAIRLCQIVCVTGIVNLCTKCVLYRTHICALTSVVKFTCSTCTHVSCCSIPRPFHQRHVLWRNRGRVN